MYRFALRSLLARRRRAVLSSLAVLLGVAMVAGTLVFTDTIHRAFRQLFAGEATGAQVVVSSPQGLYSAGDPPRSMPARLTARIRRLPGVRAVAGQVSGVAAIIGRSGRVVEGTGAPTVAVSYLPAPFTGLQIVRGRPPAGPGEVALEQATAAREGYRIGARVPIVTGEPARDFVLTGLVSVAGAPSGGPVRAVFSLDAAQALYGKQGELDAIYVKAAPRVAPAALAREIEPLLAPGISAQPESRAVNADLSQVQDRLGALTGGLEALGVVAVLVSALVIAGTLSITVAVRAHELALLRALGATRRQVLGAVVLESGVVGAVASIGGLALGLAVALGIRTALRAAGADVPSTALVFEPRTAGVALGVGMVATIAAGLAPGLRATRISPVQALRESAAPAGRGRPSRPALAAACLLAAAGAALLLLPRATVGGKLATSAAGAAALVLAAVLLSPMVVGRLGRVVAWPLERRGGGIGRLARENALRAPARTAITASSLMVGLALVLFVSVYLGGVQASARRAIDRTFTADFAIGSSDGTSSIPAAAARAVAQVPYLTAVSSLKSATATIGAARGTTAVGFDPTTLPEVYRFDWVGGPGPASAALGAGDVLLERDTARAAHLHSGQRVRVTTPAGLSAQLTVRGIYADPALLRGFALPLEEFDRLFDQDRLQQVLVKLAPGASPGAAAAELTQALRPLPGVLARSGRQLREQAGRRVENVLILFYALLAMTAAMALLGILTALSLAIHERTRELGVLRAVGMTRAQARALIRDESVITAAIGTAIGVALGVGIAWVVTRTLTAEGITFAVPWPQVGLLAIVGLAVGVVAGLPAAARAARLDILTAIAHE